MSNTHDENHSDQKSGSKAQAGNQTCDWRKIFRGVFHDLFFGSYAANVITSIAFLLVCPLIGLSMNSKKAILVGGGIGLTILVWIVVVAAIRRINTDEDTPKIIPPEKRPNIVILDTRLTFAEKPGEPLSVAFTLVNTGNEDASVSIRDKTLVFNVTLEDTKFRYQSNEALTFPVQALAGTGNHAEMKFYADLGADARRALDEGRARRFIFARGEYRDHAGRVYPLPFARMYDPRLPGSLIFCPNEITVE